MNVVSKDENMAVAPKVVEKKQFGRPREALEPTLEEWFKWLSMRNRGTAETYVRYVRCSLKKLGCSADELLNKLKTGEWNVYNKLREIIDTDKAPYTIQGEMNAIKRFLGFNEIEVDEKKFSAKVFMPKTYALTRDYIPTKDELSSMFNVATPRGRVVIVLGVHGLRIGEISALRVEDLKLDNEIPHLNVSAETAKERKGRIVPLTQQAVEVLKTYVKTQGLTGVRGVLGVSTKSIGHIIFRILDKVGIKERDERTGYHRIHPHCFRKYCKTMLAYSGCQDSFVDLILGHRKYLDESYLRAGKEMIAREFNKAIPNLTIGAVQVKIQESDRIRTLEARIDYLTKNVAKLLEIGEEHFREAYEKTLKDDIDDYNRQISKPMEVEA